MNKLEAAIDAFNKMESTDDLKEIGLDPNAFFEILTCLVALKLGEKERLAVTKDVRTAEWFKKFGLKVTEDNGWYHVAVSKEE